MTTEQPKSAYSRYNDALYELGDSEQLAALFPLGPEREHDDPATIQLDVWRYVVEQETSERTGLLKRDRGRLVVHVARELRERLDATPYEDEDGPGPFIDDSFGLCVVWQHEHRSDIEVAEWPNDYRWIACYAVTGGSEGHYIHIDLINSEGQARSLFLGKTFRGMAHAQRIAARCAELLGA